MRIASNKRKYQRLGSLRTFEIFRLRDISAVEMRIILVFILFLLLGQQTTVNGQQTSCTSDAYPRTVDCCPLSVDYYEKQIHIADSLYKNYLPQYNFDEVKAAMEFFDSIRNSGIQGLRSSGFKVTDTYLLYEFYPYLWTIGIFRRTF